METLGEFITLETRAREIRAAIETATRNAQAAAKRAEEINALVCKNIDTLAKWAAHITDLEKNLVGNLNAKSESLVKKAEKAVEAAMMEGGEKRLSALAAPISEAAAKEALGGIRQEAAEIAKKRQITNHDLDQAVAASLKKMSWRATATLVGSGIVAWSGVLLGLYFVTKFMSR